MSRDLPEFPNLDHLRKQAKARLRALRERHPAARLAEAQHAVAREYGFASWPRLKAHVASRTPPAKAAGSAGMGVIPPPAPPLPPNPGRFARYTEPARQTIFFARQWAQLRGKHDRREIEAEHLLLGLADAAGDLLDRVLGGSWGRTAVRREIERRSPAQDAPSPGPKPLSDECRRILERAAAAADGLGHARIGPGHFLLGFMAEEDALATSVLRDVLGEKGMTMEAVRRDVIRLLKEEDR